MRISGGLAARFSTHGLLLLALAGLTDSTVALAQPRTFPASLSREERDQQLDDSNKFLLDSERDFGDVRRRRPSDAPRLTAPTAEIKQLRPLVTELAEEASVFAYSINEDARRAPALRQQMPTVVKLRTQAQLLAQRVNEVNDHLELTTDFQALDAGWRDLLFGLQRSRDLSQKTKQSIATLQDIEKDIKAVVQIENSYDRNELLSRTTRLSGEMDNLLEDIQIELGQTAEARQLLIAGGKVQQQVLLLASLIQDGTDRQSVVDEYTRFQSLWYPQATKLRQVDNMILERSLRRITNADSQIQQLLQIPQKLDKQQLIYMTKVLKEDLDTFFERTPLSLLVHLKNANRALAAADQFYGVCEHFNDQVTRDEDYDQLVDSFRYIEDAQREFTEIFRDIPSKEAVAVLTQIEQTLDSLRTSLQVDRDDFDRRAAVELAASVENLTDQLSFYTKRWLQRDAQPFSRDCLAEINGMLEEATVLHQDLVAAASVNDVRPQVDRLYNRWRRIYGYLVKCQTEDRSQLGRLSSKLTPSLIDLRTMVSQ